MTVGLIAIPIVFQPELRRAQNSWDGDVFSAFLLESQEFDQMLEELMKAIPHWLRNASGR